MKSLLDDVPPNKAFCTKDGHTIKNLEELQVALNAMSDEVYEHHATEDRNDFHNWVRDVHNDEELASKLLSARNRKHAKKHVRKRVEKVRKEAKSQKWSEDVLKDYSAEATAAAPLPPDHLAKTEAAAAQTEAPSEPKKFLRGSLYELVLGMAIGLLAGLMIGRFI